MIIEEKRILKMAYLLLEADGFLKAGDFARELNLSERTVKNDMEHLRDFLKDCGCSLDSVRGKGYLLKIDRPDQFAKTREWLNILFNNVEANNREHLSYQLARAIMCRQAADEDGYFLLEELAAQLYCSASTVKKKMPWVREFFASFQLSLVTKPSHGMKLCGSELGQRLGMLELYENHFRIRVVAFENQAYERAFMDQGDKDRIRKIVLDTIRASECELFDSYVNRLVDYILLVRKRIQSGNVISKEEESQTVYHLGTIKELYATGEWELARQLLTNLREIPGYDQDSFRRDGEIAALSILFLMWGDWEQIPGLEKRFPVFYEKAENLARKTVCYLKMRWNLPEQIPKEALSEALMSDLLRILFQKHFGYEGCLMLGNSISQNAIKRSSMVLALADSIGEFLYKEEKIKISEYNTQLLGVSLYKVIDMIEYPYVPRRLLICARNGKASAQTISRDMLRRLGDWWIDDIRVEPLYEARKLRVEDYDWMIGSFKSYAYHYSWPYLQVHAMITPEDTEEIRRQVLLSGYDLKQVEKQLNWEELSVHRDFSIHSIQSILQLLSYQWGKDMEAKELLNQYFLNTIHLRVRKQLLCAIVPSCYTGKHIFDLYFFKKTMEYGDENVQAVLFIAIDFQTSAASLRFLENGIRYLQSNFEELAPHLTEKSVMEIMTEGIRCKI